MNKNIIKNKPSDIIEDTHYPLEVTINDRFITATVDVASKKCPLNWLACYYKYFKGKLVMLDDSCLDYILNLSHSDSVEIEKTASDNYQTNYIVKWNATKEYPETIVRIESYGRSKAKKESKNKSPLKKDAWHVMTELVADDILSEQDKKGNSRSFAYATNLTTDPQIIYLKAKKTKVLENVI